MAFQRTALVLVAGVLGLAIPSVSAASKLTPRLGRSVVVAPASGRVMVRRRGTRRFLVLASRQVIPVGSTVDATKGSVKLLSASDVRGRLQKGVFNGGAFTVTQQRSAETDLTLVGGRSRRTACIKARAGVLATATRLGASVLRLLHGSAHGKFQTRGTYAAATVRGTVWTTQDRCSGTEISAGRGAVLTEAIGPHLTFPISPGVTAVYRCERSGMPPVTSAYCVVVLATSIRAKPHNIVFWGAGIATRSTQQTVDFCETGPRRTSCAPFPLTPPNRYGTEGANATCVPDQGLGSYAISFRLSGKDLDGALPYQDRLTANPDYGRAGVACISQFGQSQLGAFLAPVPADVKHVNRYSLPTPAVAQDMLMYVYPTGTPGTQLIRGVVYSDAGGVPGALLGTTNELVFHSTDPAGRYRLTFPTPFNLAPGTYWIGEIAGPQNDVAAIPSDDVTASGAFNADPYSAGPTNPFGPFSFDNAQLSAYLEYYTGQI